MCLSGLAVDPFLDFLFRIGPGQNEVPYIVLLPKSNFFINHKEHEVHEAENMVHRIEGYL
jgi:hypothetical protein